MPIVISVCTDCEQAVRDVIEEAYFAGRRSVVTQVRLTGAWWAKEVEEAVYGKP